jgi:hypothetical protein
MGLFRYRCFHKDYGIIKNSSLICGYENCPSDFFCAISSENPNIPTNYDNFGYAYAQVIRVMITLGWTEPMYLSMRTFHPTTLIPYIIIFFILGIFAANLIAAVLKINYSSTIAKY